MKTINPKNNHTRRRITLDCSEPQLTDQSYKNQCDINIIMEQYKKTGLLPQQTTLQPKYTDNTIIPTLEDAFNITNAAIDAFNSLPPDIRRLMDNNPAQLELFIQNPENEYVLKKHGIIIENHIPEPEVTLKDINETLKLNNKPTEKL